MENLIFELFQGKSKRLGRNRRILAIFQYLPETESVMIIEAKDYVVWIGGGCCGLDSEKAEAFRA